MTTIDPQGEEESKRILNHEEYDEFYQSKLMRNEFEKFLQDFKQLKEKILKITEENDYHELLEQKLHVLKEFTSRINYFRNKGDENIIMYLLQIVDKVIILFPIATIYKVKGVLLDDRQRTLDALDCEKIACKLSPKNEKCFVNKIITHYKLDHFQEALFTLDQILFFWNYHDRITLLNAKRQGKTIQQFHEEQNAFYEKELLTSRETKIKQFLLDKSFSSIADILIHWDMDESCRFVKDYDFFFYMKALCYESLNQPILAWKELSRAISINAKDNNYQILKNKLVESFPNIRIDALSIDPSAVLQAIPEKYEGEEKNDKKHGQGIQWLCDRSIYQGHWIENKKHGYGRELNLSAVRELYEGNWENNVKEGTGKMWKEITRGVNEKMECFYDGQWKYDRRHGKGYEIIYVLAIIPVPNRTSSVSSALPAFSSPSSSSTAVMTETKVAREEEYSGDWFNDNKHGKGILTFRIFVPKIPTTTPPTTTTTTTTTPVKPEESNKQTTEPPHSPSSPHTTESHKEDKKATNSPSNHNSNNTNSNSNDEFDVKIERYEGDFSFNERSGRGKYYWPNGDWYEGNWLANQRHGYGIQYYAADGLTYEGDWKNDQKHGRGKMSYPADSLFDYYQGEYEHDVKSGFGKFLWRSGDYYEGFFVNNQRHGRGKQYSPGNHESYEGEWINDRKHGQGILLFKDDAPGIKYEGEFRNGKRCGYGSFVWKNNDVFDGQWQDNKRNGLGKMLYHSGKVYEGEWKNDKKEGYGKMLFPKMYHSHKQGDDDQGHSKNIYDSALFEGTWEDDKRNGHGILRLSNGDYYEGKFLHNEIHGDGLYFHQATGLYSVGLFNNKGELIRSDDENVNVNSDGTPCSFYEGAMVERNGHKVKEGKEGKGKLVLLNGLYIYDGEWENDLRHGYGKEEDSRGNHSSVLTTRPCCSYEGQWFHNEKTGHGIMYLANGDRYEGEFLKNQFHGKGKYEYSESQAIYEGEFFQNKRHGKGKFSFLHNKMSYYDGEWLKGRRHGYGKSLDEANNFYSGYFQNDEKNGFGEMIYSNGDIYEGEWIDSKRHGKGRMMFISSTIYETYDGYWENDMKNGKGIMKYSNQDIYNGEWKENLKFGHGKYLYANGETFIGQWFNDTKTGQGIFTDLNGQKKYHCYESDELMTVISMENTNPSHSSASSSSVVGSSSSSSSVISPGGSSSAPRRLSSCSIFSWTKK